MDPLTIMAIVSSISSIGEGIGQYKQSKINSQIYETQAKNIEAQQNILAEQYRTKTNQLEGQAITTSARAGVKISGSVANSISDSITQLLMDESYEQYNLKVKRIEALNNARMARYQGEQALFSAFGGAGFTALTNGMNNSNYFTTKTKKKYKNTLSGGFDTSNQSILNPKPIV